jgi:T4 RnlA family RNA ligase
MKSTLEKYYNDGLLYKQVHPTLPLTIWNYTEKVQFENLWDEVTLMCRGLVTDDKGNIVARPFRKFFNMEEGKHTPTDEFKVYEKMDGSLGILFHYEGEWVMATRGSFTSDQAVKGMEMLSNYDYHKLHKDFTYLFEIIYAENRIVCSYDFEDVVLLGAVNTKHGYEVNLHGDLDMRIQNLVKNVGLNVVKRYDGISDYSVLKQMVRDDAEGFIVLFSNGDRMKVKGVEYLRLHKIMTNVSTTAIWEVLSSGGNMDDLLKDVPDEFYKKIQDYVKQLRYQYWSVQEHAGKYFDNLYESYDRELPEKAKYAEWVKQFEKHLHPILFRMYDNKDYSSYIWRLIRPEFKKL